MGGERRQTIGERSPIRRKRIGRVREGRNVFVYQRPDGAGDDERNQLVGRIVL
jgi:hypothetical protein